ncbi:hypothetical protein WJX74_001189 [Apatococcus lobatus]|uniref:Uncharacterized protein n=1 Tax=Apatococcus lobatus TaxID=904363 RepID=A0AAW1RUL0_9CHLO
MPVERVSIDPGRVVVPVDRGTLLLVLEDQLHYHGTGAIHLDTTMLWQVVGWGVVILIAWLGRQLLNALTKTVISEGLDATTVQPTRRRSCIFAVSHVHVQHVSNPTTGSSVSQLQPNICPPDGQLKHKEDMAGMGP